MVKVLVYVEGGRGRVLDGACREGFKKFFAKAIPSDAPLEIIPCGNASETLKRFAMRLALRDPREVPVLLVDSEEPVDSEAWTHLAARQENKLKRPAEAPTDSAHLMVQCMESWFMADPDKLKNYFGKGFSANSLLNANSIETAAVDAVLVSLKKAAKVTSKGEYDKGRDSFKILALIDVEKVTKASPHAKRLIETLERLVGEA